jgi:hypothetical protein
MVRNVIRLHTLVLVTASILLLVAPVTVLQAFGVTDVSFPVLALARVLAGLVAVLAAAVVPVPDLPAPVRARALMGLATAYAFLSILTLAQEIAIWSSVAGALLSAECVLHSAAFAWLARRERASPRLATSTS